MNIEEAKEYLKNYKYDNEVYDAIAIVLNELDKKDKAIKYIEETFELEEDKCITELYNILK